MPVCFTLFKHCVIVTLRLADANAGRSMAAKMAMMAMTTNNSISVNAH
jgi:hypothetical protein